VDRLKFEALREAVHRFNENPYTLTIMVSKR
jgi:hypothetical protein